MNGGLCTFWASQNSAIGGSIWRSADVVISLFSLTAVHQSCGIDG